MLLYFEPYHRAYDLGPRSTSTTTQTTTDVLTETVTSTYTPTQSPYLKITSSTVTARVGHYITLGTCNGNTCLQWDYSSAGVSAAGKFIVSDTGVWSLRDSPSLTAYIYANTAGVIAIVNFISSTTADSLGYTTIACSVDDAGAFTCQSSTSLAYDILVACGAWVYIILSEDGHISSLRLLEGWTVIINIISGALVRNLWHLAQVFVETYHTVQNKHDLKRGKVFNRLHRSTVGKFKPAASPVYEILSPAAAAALSSHKRLLLSGFSETEEILGSTGTSVG
ncbi:hypothetical protein F5B19DRAFT_491075 [Rostrohypoxylon terebratum]|nr:hypothetical protein F5B19DRAFT_491075 [Rostrohypoxylon terebratum]